MITERQSQTTVSLLRHRVVVFTVLLVASAIVWCCWPQRRKCLLLEVEVESAERMNDPKSLWSRGYDRSMLSVLSVHEPMEENQEYARNDTLLERVWSLDVWCTYDMFGETSLFFLRFDRSIFFGHSTKAQVAHLAISTNIAILLQRTKALVRPISARPVRTRSFRRRASMSASRFASKRLAWTRSTCRSCSYCSRRRFNLEESEKEIKTSSTSVLTSHRIHSFRQMLPLVSLKRSTKTRDPNETLVRSHSQEWCWSVLLRDHFHCLGSEILPPDDRIHVPIANCCKENVEKLALTDCGQPSTDLNSFSSWSDRSFLLIRSLIRFKRDSLTFAWRELANFGGSARGRRGFLQRGKNRRKPRWWWENQFHLQRTASMLIDDLKTRRDLLLTVDGSDHCRYSERKSKSDKSVQGCHLLSSLVWSTREYWSSVSAWVWERWPVQWQIEYGWSFSLDGVHWCSHCDWVEHLLGRAKVDRW